MHVRACPTHWKCSLFVCFNGFRGMPEHAGSCGGFGPGRIRTYDQGIHFAPAFPPGVDYLFTRARRGASCVWVRDAHACHQGHSSPQVVSAPSAGVPAARLRVAMGCYAEGFPEFIPSTSRVSTRRHLVDESPALTAV